MCVFGPQVYDGLLLEGTLADYESAFKAVDKSGNGTIGESGRRRTQEIDGTLEWVLGVACTHPGHGARELRWLVSSRGTNLSWEL